MCNRPFPLFVWASIVSMATVTAAQTPPSDSKRSAAPSRVAMPAIEIPFEKFVLDNGLTLIVHEDRKAPIVAVNVWYHVGSKNEKPGRTGFAHLFEHLMFNGTEHYNDDYFKPLEKAGATDMNGTTNVDRTNYFQNVPTSALDLVLWLESDRMGHLLPAIDQARLDEQRGVVQNEKRQGENQPYGITRQLLSENTYPVGHPYSWTTIGSMEDLGAAKLDDVREWFKTYYGTANAVIAIAGDIDAATAKKKVEQYFGHIPAGPPVAKQERWIAKMTGTKRGRVQDRVPQARVYKVWNVPEWESIDADHLALVSNVLASGKSSRLYKRLVYDDQIATDVNAFVWQKEIGSQFYIQATAKPGGDLAAVEKAIDEELARFLKTGPTAAELERIKTEYHANFVRGIERIGGFGGKSDILATNQVYGGRPDYYKLTLERVAKATPDDLRRVSNDWLSDGVYVLEVHPFPQYTTQTTSLDRSSLPQLQPPPAPKFPAIKTSTLSNGLKVYLAERPSVPLVNVRLLVDAGYAADQGGKLGTASLALNMLDEGTKTRNALEISDELSRLGAQLSTGSSVDFSTVSLSALEPNLDASLTVLADVVRNPAFPQTDFARLQKQQMAQIKREKVTPFSMGLRVLPALLYGQGHAYAVPLTGSGTEDSVATIARDDLVRFHQSWFKPNNTAIVITGATSMEKIVPLLEKHFGAWAKGDVPRKNIGDVTLKAQSEVYLIDRPGSQQSIILAGHLAPPKRNKNEIAIEAVNDLLGGSFTSRINMNLREDKHWSYGAGTIVLDARGQRPLMVYAPVQTDKTKESIEEVAKELRTVVGDKPLTGDELTKVQDSLTRRLPGRWETIGAVQGSVGEIVQFDLPLDYYDHYAAAVQALQLPQVNAVAKELIHPQRLVWVIVGDREKIEAGVRALNLGPIQLLDADGKPLGQPATSSASR